MGRAVLRRRNLDAASADSSIASRPDGSALWVWSAFALAMMLVALPLFSTVVPPLLDYPNHLARMHLLAEGGDAFYAVRWAALPNLAEDLIVPPLARLMPLDIAAKLFLVMTFALMAGSAIWLNRVASGGWRLWPLLGFLLLYNRIFLWGFLNYLFGIGVALVGAALWLTLEGRRSWLRVLSSSLVALACFFSHVAAFGFYALVILGIEVEPAMAELRARRWPALGRRMVVAGAQFVAPTVLFLGNWRENVGGTISYAEIWRKADLLFSVFDNYDRAFDIACFGFFSSASSAGSRGRDALVSLAGSVGRPGSSSSPICCCRARCTAGRGSITGCLRRFFCCLSRRAHLAFRIGAWPPRSGSLPRCCWSSAWA